jgi:hypothetical protein
VVLQEQSQIPGFPQDQSDFRASRRAAEDLDDRIEASGAQTLLLLTWGRRAGDEANRERFPDFTTMQAALTDGYLAYRDATSTEARPTWIAPAGPAFARVYAATLADAASPQLIIADLCSNSAKIRAPFFLAAEAAGMLHHFVGGGTDAVLDESWRDAAVLDDAFERNARDFAADWVEAGNHC